MYKRLIPFSLCLVLATFGRAQVGVPTFPSQSEIDSLNTPIETEVDTPVIEPLDLETIEAELAFLKQKYRKDWKPVLGLDNHYSAFFGQSTKIWGLKLGVEIYQGYRVGLAAYYLPKKVAMTPIHEEGALDSVYRKFRMHYYNTFMEFILFQSWKWEVALPFSLGYGIANIERWDPLRKKWNKAPNRGGFVTTVAFNAQYKIFSWIGIGVGLGYRQVISKEADIQRDLSGLMVTLKFKLFLSHLYKGIFKPQALREEKGDARYVKYLKKERKRIKRRKS